MLLLKTINNNLIEIEGRDIRYIRPARPDADTQLRVYHQGDTEGILIYEGTTEQCNRFCEKLYAALDKRGLILQVDW